MWQDQPQIQPSIHKEEDMHMSPQKRRLVVRVPFAQIPDNIQLNRIYKSLFTQQKAKKMSMRSWFDE
jgi:hypothetical protein